MRARRPCVRPQHHAFGVNVMDTTTRPPADRAGNGQGRDIADLLTEFWRCRPRNPEYLCSHLARRAGRMAHHEAVVRGYGLTMTQYAALFGDPASQASP